MALPSASSAARLWKSDENVQFKKFAQNCNDSTRRQHRTPAHGTISGPEFLVQCPGADWNFTAASTSGTSTMTGTGQPPLETQSHEGFWGHMNPMARKKWVNRQLNPVKDRLNELDQVSAANARDIKDVDARAQAGIPRLRTPRIRPISMPQPLETLRIRRSRQRSRPALRPLRSERPSAIWINTRL